MSSNSFNYPYGSQRMVTHANNGMVATSQPLAAQAGTSNQALLKCEKWQIDFQTPHDLIVAGNAIIAGIDNEVRALNIETGELLWSAAIKGRAMGLAVIDGRLYVSSHHGDVYAFAAP